MSGAEGALKIAVAGGSIGGLCAGIALHGAGFDVQVYERVSGPMETRGAGIVVQRRIDRPVADPWGGRVANDALQRASLSHPRRR